MKKYLLFLFIILFCNCGIGQTMKASLGAGSVPNSIRIYLKSDVAQPAAVFSTLQFNVALPASVSPVPTLTVLSSAFSGVTWIVGTPYVESGYINYNIYTGASGFQMAVTTSEFQAMEVAFSGGPNGSMINAAHLVTLPDGGIGNNSYGLFYCTGTLNSNGQQLYYARDANVVVNNGDSYAPLRPGQRGSPLGTATSFARFLPGIVLPIKFTDFTALRKNNDGILTWVVENQDPNTRDFVIERSFNGSDFTGIGTVPVNFNNGSVGTYTYTDIKITDLRSSGVIYYRIKEIDKDGKVVYTQIKNIKLDNKAFAINLYPNPAKNYTYITIDLSENSQIVMNITDVAGKAIRKIELAGVKGVNQKRINLSGLAAGSYMIHILTDGQSQTIPLVKSE